MAVKLEKYHMHEEKSQYLVEYYQLILVEYVVWFKTVKSEAILPPIPIQFCHLFRFKPATHSEAILPPIPK